MKVGNVVFAGVPVLVPVTVGVEVRVGVLVEVANLAANWKPPKAQDPVPSNCANKSWTPVIFLKEAGKVRTRVWGPETVTLAAAANVPPRLSSVKVKGPVQAPEK